MRNHNGTQVTENDPPSVAEPFRACLRTEAEGDACFARDGASAAATPAQQRLLSGDTHTPAEGAAPLLHFPPTQNQNADGERIVGVLRQALSRLGTRIRYAFRHSTLRL